MDKYHFERIDFMLRLNLLLEEWKSISGEELSLTDGEKWNGKVFQQLSMSEQLLAGYREIERLQDGKPAHKGQWKEMYAQAQGLIQRLRKEVREKQEVLEYKNKELELLHYVWCSGCSIGNGKELTIEDVKRASRYARRLYAAFYNITWKKKKEEAYIQAKQELGATDFPDDYKTPVELAAILYAEFYENEAGVFSWDALLARAEGKIPIIEQWVESLKKWANSKDYAERVLPTKAMNQEQAIKEVARWRKVAKMLEAG